MNSKKIFLSLILVCLSFSLFSQEKADALKLYRKGDYLKAAEVCQSEIEVKPNNVDSYVVLCWALIANHQYAEAEVWGNKARTIAPNDARVIKNLAESKYYQGKNDEALELFQTYISNVRNDSKDIASIYYFLGEIYIRKGYFHHADIAFSQAVMMSPLKDVWWVRLGYAREMAKDYKLSLKAYDKALTLNSQNAEAKSGKARVLPHIR